MKLYKLEAEVLAKVSKIYGSICLPKSIERQSVAIFLRTLCEGTYTTIINHPNIGKLDGSEHAATFIKIGTRY